MTTTQIRTRQSYSTSTMTDAVLKKSSTGFLNIMLKELRLEAAKCRTEASYEPVRAQIVRVRAALIARGAL